MEGRCQCGQIKFTTPTAAPLALFICHCTQCRHQSSSLFGCTAIFAQFELPEPFAGAIAEFVRTTRRGRRSRCLFCAKCGSRLVHRVDGEKNMSIKGGCLEDGKIDWAKAVHIWTKEAVVPIPDGVESFPEEPPR